jgi:hypothetical protein
VKTRTGPSGPISPPLRRDLLWYLQATSSERAALLGKLFQTNPGIADVLADLEDDDDLRAQYELALGHGRLAPPRLPAGA